MSETVASIEPPERAEADTVDTTIGRYRLIRILGQGGMGVVWRAHDPDLSRDIALKLMRDAGPDARERMQREARAMARLVHPNVVTVYEVGDVGGRAFIAMEVVEGTSLDVWLTASPRPPQREIVAALVAAGRGLAAAHEAGVAHRDFKPHNILRARTGRVVVTDFGIARALDDAAPLTPTARARVERLLPRSEATAFADTTAGDAPLTRTGAFVGTPAYMAPEQFTGSPPNTRTDQFAFCVTAWQALAGAHPFPGPSIEDIARAVVAGVASVRADLPRRLRTVLARGLDPDPSRRWPDMATLLAAFERAARAARGRSRRIALMAAALVLAIVAGGLVVISQRAPPPPEICGDPAAAFPQTWPSDVYPMFDRARDRWIHEVSAACTQPAAERDASLVCLGDLHDRLDVGAQVVLVTFGAHPRDRVEVPDDLAVGPCPGMAVPPPTEATTRDAIRAVRTLLAEHRYRDRHDVVTSREVDFILAQARALNWRPLVLEAELVAGSVAKRAGQYADARRLLEQATASATITGDLEREALARVLLAEIAMTSLASPDDPTETERAIAEAEDVLHRAGAEPVLSARVVAVRAAIEIGQGQIGPGLVDLEHARLVFFEQTAPAHAYAATHLEVDTLLARGHRDDSRRAFTLAQGFDMNFRASSLHARHEQFGSEYLWRWSYDELISKVTTASGFEAPEPTDAETAAATARPMRPIRTCAGQVLDPAGQPMVDADVVVWTGALVGSAHMHRADASHAHVALATTDYAGRFSLVMPPGDSPAVMAERVLMGMRSSPVLVDCTSPLRLQLEPKPRLFRRRLTGDPRPVGMHVRAEFLLSANTSWAERAPVTADGDFELANLPSGHRALLAVATVPGGIRIQHLRADADAVEWSAGRLFHVVVRHARGPARTWVLQKGTLEVPEVADADTRRSPFLGELAVALRRSEDRVEVELAPIGAWNYFADDAVEYVAGDLHARFHGSAGLVNVCASDGIAMNCQAQFDGNADGPPPMKTIVLDLAQSPDLDVDPLPQPR